MSDYTSHKIISLSAPSGAGKTTIIRELAARMPQLALSISATNRSPRHYEVDGVHYHFVSTERFMQYIKSGAFVEWEEVYEGRFYGTLISEVERIVNEGKSPVFDVDVLGGLHLKKIFGDSALALFIEPPSIEALKERLTKRGTENAKDLETRIRKATSEMAYADRFDHRILNDDLELAVAMTQQYIKGFLNK